MNKNFNIINGSDSVFFKDIDTVRFVNNGLVIDCVGKNNEIIIGRNVRINNFKISIECNNSRIEIGDNVSISGNVVMKLADGNSLIIGDNTTIGGANFICGESKSILIGKNCMIAWGIEFRNTDSHAILDLSTNVRINHAQDIIIEDEVWIGAHVTLLKGTVVKKGSVVSIKSLVNKNFDESNVIIGGVPGKILRRNIYWERKLLG